MAKNSGWYVFEDGYTCWYAGISKNELAWEIAKHGKLIRIEK